MFGSNSQLSNEYKKKDRGAGQEQKKKAESLGPRTSTPSLFVLALYRGLFFIGHLKKKQK
jgi:hypothetical protein